MKKVFEFLRASVIGVLIVGFFSGCAQTLDKFFISLEDRPQEPKERNYIVQKVNFQGGDKDVILAGELTYPKGKGPFTALVLITGYGSQHKPFDRDYNLGDLVGHKSYLVLSDLLTKRGYAVLRYDNRGVRESTGDWYEATDPMFAADAASAMKWLKNKSGVSLSKVGYIGHSQGGIKAPMAAKIESADFMVLLAGGVESTAEIMVTQVMQKAEELKMSGKEKKEMFNQIESILSILRKSKDRHQAKEKIKQYYIAQGSSLQEAEIVSQEYSKPVDFESLDRNWESVIKSLHIPILSLYGGKDKLVLVEKNIERNKKVLKNPKSKVKLFPKMNHMFQPATRGGVDEYWEIDTTFDESVVSYIDAWIKEVQ